MLERLSEYYRQHDISAMDFCCEHAKECRNACGNFVEAKEAFVGSGYERGELPRLLFLSLDPSSDEERHPLERTVLAVRQRYEKDYGHDGPSKGTHWYETHDFAHSFFQAITAGRTDEPAKACRSLSKWGINKYFAHTNSAKCKDMSRGSKQGRNVLFRNCSQFIQGEVETLEPDIIITQGTHAELAIRCFRDTLAPLRHSEKGNFEIHRISVNGKPVLRVSTYHPCARGRHYRAKERERQEAFPWYIQTLAEEVVYLLKAHGS